MTLSQIAYKEPAFHTGIRTANTRLGTAAQKFLDNLFWECKWQMVKNEISVSV